MNSNASLANCVCLSNCEEVSFNTQVSTHSWTLKKKREGLASQILSMQVNSYEFETKELCNFFGDWSTIDFVMSDWQKTHSPLAYWYGQMSAANRAQRVESLELDRSTLSGGGSNISYGVPTEEAIDMCKFIYGPDIAKLTIKERLNIQETTNITNRITHYLCTDRRSQRDADPEERQGHFRRSARRNWCDIHPKPPKRSFLIPTTSLLQVERSVCLPEPAS